MQSFYRGPTQRHRFLFELLRPCLPRRWIAQRRSCHRAARSRTARVQADSDSPADSAALRIRASWSGFIRSRIAAPVFWTHTLLGHHPLRLFQLPFSVP